MSCSLHDVMRLEDAGVPTALLVTDAFRRSVAEQAPLLGLGSYRPVWVEHPVAGLRRPAAERRADAVAPAVAAVLLGLAVEPQLAAVPSAAEDDRGPVRPPDSPLRAAGDADADLEQISNTAAGPDCTDAACAIDLSELGR